MAVRTGLTDEFTEVLNVSAKCQMSHYPGSVITLEDREAPQCPICGEAVDHRDYGRYIYLRTRGEARIRTRFAHQDCVLDTMRLPRHSSSPAAVEVC